MQEMVQRKVCRIMTKVIQKLGEINPDFQDLDVPELCAVGAGDYTDEDNEIGRAHV